MIRKMSADDVLNTIGGEEICFEDGNYAYAYSESTGRTFYVEGCVGYNDGNLDLSGATVTEVDSYRQAVTDWSLSEKSTFDDNGAVIDGITPYTRIDIP